jgi:hypothetical protein
MTKIRTSNQTVGRKGGWGKTINRFTGNRVSRSKGTRVQGVRRLFARNPATRTANIGTARDVNPTTAVNMQSQPSPTIRKAPNYARNATQSGVKSVSNKNATNRSVKRTNS